MTFAQIKARVRRYLIDITEGLTDELDLWVNHGIRKAQDRHNFRAMEEVEPYITTEGVRILSKPADWKEFRVFPWLNEDGQTKEIRIAPSHSEMVRMYGEDPDIDTGEPKYILEQESQFLVYPIPDRNSLNPDGNYRINLPYWKYLPTLVQDADTNYFTIEMPDYCAFYAIAEGMVFNREEERASVYLGKAEQELQLAISKDKRSRLPRRLSLAAYSDVYGNTGQIRR